MYSIKGISKHIITNLTTNFQGTCSIKNVFNIVPEIHFKATVAHFFPQLTDTDITIFDCVWGEHFMPCTLCRWYEKM